MPSNNVLDISLTASDGSNNLYISTTDSALNVMTLTITNPSLDSGAGFQQYNGGAYSIGTMDSHDSGIYVLFNGLLSDDVIAAITFNLGDDWTYAMGSDDQNGTYWVLLPNRNVNLASGESVTGTIQFPAITGSAISGYFSCYYTNLSYAGSKITGGEQLYVELVYPFSASTLLPVQFEVVGDNEVFSGSFSSLTFRITNISPEALIPGGSDAWGFNPPKLSLRFIQNDSNTKGSLLSKTYAGQVNVDQIEYYQNNLKIEKQTGSNDPQLWFITENTDLPASDGQFLHTGISASITFRTTNMLSYAAPGSISMAVLEYSGFPGYQDGQLTAEIRISQSVQLPTITQFYAVPAKINISQLGKTPVYLYYYSDCSTAVYQGNTYLNAFEYDPTTSCYKQQVNIISTTSFLLTSTNSAGKVSSRVVTVEVDEVPIGTISMWNGNYADIPEGWVLCAGQHIAVNNQTIIVPDLRGRFPVGLYPSSDSSSSYTGTHYLRQTGGGGTHHHSVTTSAKTVTSSSESSHRHQMDLKSNNKFKTDSSGTRVYYSSDEFLTTDQTDSHSHTISIPQKTESTSYDIADLPPYCAVYYIMKLV